jgi:ribonuclease P protein component
VEAAPLLGPGAPEAVRDSLFSTTATAEFTAPYRLLREDGFNHVVHAENFTDKYFKIFFVRNGKKNARLGIVASKRILPGAAQRNRIKRVIREAFRQHSIKTQQIDLVVMVRGVDTHSSQSEDLKTLFTRVEDKCASS